MTLTTQATVRPNDEWYSSGYYLDMVVSQRKFVINANKAEAPYATLLTLNACGYSANKSVAFGAEKLELNLDSVRLNNDISVARFIAQSSGKEDFIGTDAFEKAQIDEIVTLCEYVVDGFLSAEDALSNVQIKIDGTICGRFTLADAAVFSIVSTDDKLKKKFDSMFNAVVKNSQLFEAHQIVGKFDAPKPINTKVAAKVSGEKQKDEGKFVDLPGAEKGKVVVRFPPEASGYLHIGHAKAALLNQYYQQTFEGQLIMRFDDTNPAKENAHFENVIKEDLKLLNIVPDRWTHSSDHFEVLLSLCEKLLQEGKAFVDDTDTETMRAEREQRVDSKNRNMAPAECLALWEEMKKGTARGQQCCVRIKIDMKSNNGAMRDPTIYRCKPEEHVRTGTQYKVYPTYDFTCPIVDSIEGVTHALRTTEYHDRDDQYYFICDALQLRKPYIWEYARLNMTNTVMSKRKLTWFVDEHHVEGWDDPRLPTVRGVIRRGLTVDGLKQFIVAQGGSRSVVMMEWDKIWAMNKKVIDPVAPRFTALEKAGIVTVNVASAKDETAQVALHPKNADIGMKTIYRGSKLLVEGVDAELMKAGETVTFVNWGNLSISKKDKKSLDAQLNLDNTDYKKTLKVTWLGASGVQIPVVAVNYDHIISKAIIGKDEDWKQYINYNSQHFVEMVGEPALAAVKKGDIIQLQRKGFYIVDQPYQAASAFSGQPTPLLLISIPDGSQQKEAPVAAKAAPAPAKVGGAGMGLYNQLEMQGALVRDLKGKDAKSQATKDAISKLLELKKAFKEATGSDYVAGKPPAAEEPASAIGSAGDALGVYNEIEEQGNTVRTLKGKDPKGDATKMAINKLLELKKKYKEMTGQDHKPGQPPAASTPVSASAGANLYAKIDSQGVLVRDLKSKDAKSQATKDAIAKLLELKKQYKEVTGQEYKPGQAPVASTPVPAKPAGNSESDIYNQIEQQGNVVRDLKGKDAKSQATKDAIATLLALKKEYKEKTGKDYQPGKAPTPTAAPAGGEADAYAEIEAQGNLVRDEKTKDAKSPATKAAIEKLLSLKKQYKDKFGKDYQPGKAPVPASSPAPVPMGDLDSMISKQGDLVRELKAKDAKSQATKDAIAKLLDLKKDYKAKTGKDYQPGKAPATAVAPASASACGDLDTVISKQGDLVRELKAKDAKSQATKDAIAKLLELKKDYKEKTGKDYQPAAPAKKDKVAAQKKESAAPKKEKGGAGKKDKTDEGKKTKLGIDTKKDDNYSEWYSQVITKAEMIEYYDVSGCYVLRPWSYQIWEQIKKFFDRRIKRLGVRNCYFPIFVSQAALEREKDHIADFAPEVAWVTRAGQSEMAEPIAIRPTSETVMYPSYKKWVQSHRDLPLKLNQWCNIVRWEFKHPTPFLRTREFLWQEGHTAFASPAEAEAEVFQILDLYAAVYQDLLAVPVIKGRKSEKEKFAGGKFTTTVEAYVPVNGRGVQGATSHHLGQNFSKMFDITYECPESGGKAFAWQNSWGLTTRTIGAMVMVHGDDNGLVLPPRVAAIQVIVLPVGITASTSADERLKLTNHVDNIAKQLVEKGVRAEADCRDNYSPGWKFNHWELKGVPIRIEVGPKDVAASQVTAVIRFDGAKKAIPVSEMEAAIPQMLEDIHHAMFNKVVAERDAHTAMCSDMEEFRRLLDDKFILLSPFCGRPECEENIKRDSVRVEAADAGAAQMGAKTLCIPLEQPTQALPHKCLHPECAHKPTAFALFGRSY